MKYSYLVRSSSLLISSSLSAFLISIVPATAYEIESNSFVSQFATPENESFIGTDEIVPVLPSVDSEQISTDGNVVTRASATPLELNAFFSTVGSGIARAGANASFEDIGIVFEDNQALRNLIGSDDTGINLLLNFDIDYRLETLKNPGIPRQSLSFLDINLGASSAGSVNSTGGNAQIINGPFEFSFDNSGFLLGLPENGGTARATVPIRISTSADDNIGLSAFFSAFAQVDGLALSSGVFDGGFANGRVSVKLPELPFFVTTSDGTPVTSLGVNYNLIPRTVNNPNPNPKPIPEPGTIFGVLAFASLNTASKLKRRHSSKKFLAQNITTK